MTLTEIQHDNGSGICTKPRESEYAYDHENDGECDEGDAKNDGKSLLSSHRRLERDDQTNVFYRRGHLAEAYGERGDRYFGRRPVEMVDDEGDDGDETEEQCATSEHAKRPEWPDGMQQSDE